MVRLSTVCRGRGAPERVIDLLLRLQNINITYQRFFCLCIIIIIIREVQFYDFILYLGRHKQLIIY